MSNTNLAGDEITRSLAYAGFVLLAFELTKGLIVRPIRAFYAHTTFDPAMPFKSYEQDVLSRHRHEFEACLLYLRDFMQAIDAADVEAVQSLREHRNALAHDLRAQLGSLSIADNIPLLEGADRALFKLSNYRIYMEIGSDPDFRNQGIDWNTVVGGDYGLFRRVLNDIKALSEGRM